MLDFRDIAFGFASAEAERSQDPSLLTDGYIDYKAASKEAMDGHSIYFSDIRALGSHQ
jgi:hypothetical protein